ncbi:hypothetical protein RRG08_006379 [Elysia crispata]|uniref:Uncharacterized protein n=1 Tax=Elysia crispata TaxID=231223 RepID=A0AAE0YBL0_9GAST|nr:hypothetical protein RRG08_006379 [Elysia crispata]
MALPSEKAKLLLGRKKSFYPKARTRLCYEACTCFALHSHKSLTSLFFFPRCAEQLQDREMTIRRHNLTTTSKVQSLRKTCNAPESAPKPDVDCHHKDDLSTDQ